MSRAKGIAAAVTIAACWFGLARALADPIAMGSGRQTVDLDGIRLKVFTYRPDGCADLSLLLVFHGNARDADRYRDDARALADKNCLLVVAPLLDRRTFPLWRYQHGGVVRDGVVQDPRDWTGRLVPALVDWVRTQEGRPLAYSLLGHSAGAQFLDRLAAFVPTEARRIVVANPGSYVFPSLQIAAPYGLGKVYSGADGEAQLRRYLESRSRSISARVTSGPTIAIQVRKRRRKAHRVTSADATHSTSQKRWRRPAAGHSTGGWSSCPASATTRARCSPRRRRPRHWRRKWPFVGRASAARRRQIHTNATVRVSS
jgi:dienelactone hydrolase